MTVQENVRNPWFFNQWSIMDSLDDGLLNNNFLSFAKAGHLHLGLEDKQ